MLPIFWSIIKASGMRRDDYWWQQLILEQKWKFGSFWLDSAVAFPVYIYSSDPTCIAGFEKSIVKFKGKNKTESASRQIPGIRNSWLSIDRKVRVAV